MHDEAPIGIEVAGRVQALDESPSRADALERRPTHARHDPHVEHDIGAVGDLNAATRDTANRSVPCNRARRRACARHAAGEQGIHLRVRVIGRHPLVVGAGIVAIPGADEGQVLDAGDVVGVGAVQIAAGKVFCLSGSSSLLRRSARARALDTRRRCRRTSKSSPAA